MFVEKQLPKFILPARKKQSILIKKKYSHSKNKQFCFYLFVYLSIILNSSRQKKRNK